MWIIFVKKYEEQNPFRTYNLGMEGFFYMPDFVVKNICRQVIVF